MSDRTRGVTDTPEAMFDYIMNLNTYQTLPSLVRILCDQSATTIEWLTTLGVNFKPEHLYISGIEGLPRGHRIDGNGVELIERLEQAALQAGVNFAFRTRVRSLRMAADAVAGIEVEGSIISAHSVVLATGGYGANPELIARYYPGATTEYWYPGTRHAQGDGLSLGVDAGASLGGSDSGLAGHSPGLVRELDSYLPGWVIFVNRLGRRFIRETAAYAVMPSVMHGQPGKEAFVIFDENARRNARIITTYKALAPSWTADNLLQFARQGKLTTAATVEELANAAAIPAGTLHHTLAAYNADCDRGFDSAFFKETQYLQPVREPPFYLARLRPCIVGITEKGLRVDTDARVLRENDEPVAGLFAAGETTAVLPKIYPGGGASLANCMTFGRIAGRGAAATRKS